MDFISVPAITVVCYLLAEIYKAAIRNEDLYRFIPVMCGVIGAALGIMCYIAWPGYIPAENPLVAAVIGIVSGEAATGAHQLIKQSKNS